MKRVSVKKKRKTGEVIVRHKLKKHEHLGLMELDIITKEEIPVLFPVEYKKNIFGRKLIFRISEHETLDTILNENLSFGAFLEIILQIIEAIQGCESHGIRCCNLEMQSKRVFYNRKENRVRMVYWPLITLLEQENIAQHFIAYGNLYAKNGASRENCENYLHFFTSRKPFSLDNFKVHVETLLQQWKAN